MGLDDEFRGQARHHLGALTAALVGWLADRLEAPFPAAMHLLDFEVFSDAFPVEFPVWMYAKDRHAAPLEDGTEPVLPEVSCTLPQEVLYDDRYLAPDINIWSIAAEELITWFASCWRAAGGLDFPHPAYIAPHDHGRSFDLRRNVWVTDSAKWPTTEGGG
jgi:hypothetical protein